MKGDVLTSDDGLAPSDALVAAIRTQGGTRVQTQHFTTDHNWSNSRLGLQTAIATWLQTLPGMNASGPQVTRAGTEPLSRKLLLLGE